MMRSKPSTSITVSQSVQNAAAVAAVVGAIGLIAGCSLTFSGHSEIWRQHTKASPYPETKKQQIEETMFGTRVADPYRWLESTDDAAVQEWLQAQGDYADSLLEQLPAKEWFAERLEELFYVDRIGTPTVRGNRHFFMRRAADAEQSALWVRETDGEERRLLDPDSWEYGERASLGRWVASPDGELISFQVRPNNADEADLFLLNVDTGEEIIGGRIGGARYASPSWTPDSSGFYYTFLPSGPNIPVDERPGFAEIRYHAIGTNPTSDPVIRERTGNPQQFIGCEITHDGRWLLYYEQTGWSNTEIWFRPANEPGTEWKPIFTGYDATAEAIAFGDALYVKTDLDAPRGRIIRIDFGDPRPTAWTTVVPQDPSAVIEGFVVANDRLVVRRLDKASNQLRIHTLAGSVVQDVVLPGIGSVGRLSAPRLGEPGPVYFGFSSYTFPSQVLELDVRRGTTREWATTNVPVDPTPYVVEQVRYPSKDGTLVSMFLVHRKDLVRDGSTPFLLYGYGGFNVSLTPSFSSSLYAWLEAGGGYAVANLRGGGEYGEAWHQAGMLHNKQNVFDDFIHAAKYLTKEGYTKSNRLAIRGGSNGGLLVGACMTQAPDAFEAVVCEVPLLDMVRYHRFGSGRTWIPEYGTAEKEADFRVLHAYSPYHRVEDGTDYPAMLMMSSLSDDRVDPLHARKMVAALQAADPGSEPILLRVERNAGHGGAGRVSAWVEKSADMYGFLHEALGMDPDSLPENRAVEVSQR